jgi:phosphate-selective porin
MAEQKWNDKWSTFGRYFSADFDTDGYSSTKTWGVGINYQYNPAVKFELSYDAMDYGTGNPHGLRNGDYGVVLFRTFASF